jgi:hypothetical protein
MLPSRIVISIVADSTPSAAQRERSGAVSRDADSEREVEGRVVSLAIGETVTDSFVRDDP